MEQEGRAADPDEQTAYQRAFHELVARYNATCRGEQTLPARANVIDRLLGVNAPERM